MSNINWTVRLTLTSSARQRTEEIAHQDGRSVANYVRRLIEKDIKEKDIQQ